MGRRWEAGTGKINNTSALPGVEETHYPRVVDPRDFISKSHFCLIITAWGKKGKTKL